MQWRHSDHFCPIYNTIQFFQICRKRIEIARNGAKTGQNGAIFGLGVVQYENLSKKTLNHKKKQFGVLHFLAFLSKKSSENMNCKIRGH